MEKSNIKITIAYDGTNYFGFQRQKNVLTIQEVLEEALEKLYDHEIKILAAGRTDSGVHAKGQVVNFRTFNDRIPVDKLPLALNSVLPDDMVAKEAAKVPLEFNSRKHAKKKKYRYYCYKSYHRDPFLRNYAYQLKEWNLNYDKMNEACREFIGKYDFTAFSASGTEVENKVREIFDLNMSNTKDSLTFEFLGDGFLYKMVRIIVGTIIKIGKEKTCPSKVKDIINKKDRSLAGPTIAPHGLYLEKVYY